MKMGAVKILLLALGCIAVIGTLLPFLTLLGSGEPAIKPPTGAALPPKARPPRPPAIPKPFATSSHERNPSKGAPIKPPKPSDVTRPPKPAETPSEEPKTTIKDPKKPISPPKPAEKPSVVHEEPKTTAKDPKKPISPPKPVEKSSSSSTAEQVVPLNIAVVGPLTEYSSKHLSFPIVCLAYNRPEMLQKTLRALLGVDGVTKSDITVVQDGALAKVAEVARDFGVALIQNTDGIRLRGAARMDGAQRIATHYKFALSSMFDSDSHSAPAIVVVEDDFDFSPDFMRYFRATAAAMDRDASILAVSAWNDNGLQEHVKSPFRLHRTDFFPGLGWLCTRELYKSELEKMWPREHWDHWMRQHAQHKGREIVYPEIPRDYHIGTKGTFMDANTHKKYFERIMMQKELLPWDSSEAKAAVEHVEKDNYEKQLREELETAVTVSSLEQLSEDGDAPLLVWYRAIPTAQTDFQPISTFFSIWHESRRGQHRGCLHEFWWNDKTRKVFLINTYSENPYAKRFKSAGAKVFYATDFRDAAALKFVPKNLVAVAAAENQVGWDCSSVCQERGMSCDFRGFVSVNTCEKLKEAFPCVGCEENQGLDQPAFVTADAPAGKVAMRWFLPHSPQLPSKCLVNQRAEFSCTGKFPVTRRLCPCV